jgi:hypothetical protein
MSNWVQPLHPWGGHLPFGERGETQNLEGESACPVRPALLPAKRLEIAAGGRLVPRPRTYEPVSPPLVAWDRAGGFDVTGPQCGVASRGGGWAASLRPRSLPLPPRRVMRPCAREAFSARVRRIIAIDSALGIRCAAPFVRPWVSFKQRGREMSARTLSCSMSYSLFFERWRG